MGRRRRRHGLIYWTAKASMVWPLQGMWYAGKGIAKGGQAVTRQLLQTTEEVPRNSERQQLAAVAYQLMSPEQAEHRCAVWMQQLGLENVAVTRYNHDGGVDVTSVTHVAQVKAYAPDKSIGEPPIRDLAGTAMSHRRWPIFFASCRYTPAAKSFADRMSVALFQFAPDGSQFFPVNQTAQRLHQTLKARPIPPAGWYYDPHGQVRWWDGQQWTAQVMPADPRPALPK